MRVEIAHITPRRGRLKSAPARAMLDDYIKRASRYEPTQATAYDSEAAMLTALERSSQRSPTVVTLLDSRGDSLTSTGIAQRLGRLRDGGAQALTFAVGPSDGWSPALWGQPHFHLSLGAITMPHELALVVLAEQLYRGLTILAGHPYHSGHE